MEKYGVNDLRRMFLEFFEKKDHLVAGSYSLVPHNDNSLLLINAGMAPLKPYFTGVEKPPKTRMATCQKCVRTGDIENVGKTARHLTFFEMLGNFSFGDYFKEEALKWSWEFLTEVIGLDKERLYPSIYSEDDEAFEIWTKVIGVPAEKITRFYRDPDTGECDNFWEHGAGPCGPCSEIYYDRGEKYGCSDPNCKVGCDCDRFMEVWNDVFTQYNGDGHGNYEELEKKNIDTGMGLERLAVVVQDVDSVFDIDTMKAIRDRICELASKKYHVDATDDISIRLICDHIRSAAFLISDGVMPSNEGRGYVLRRLIRRAARHGRLLKINGTFLAELSKTVIETSKDGYPELEEKREFILNVLTQEEEKFNKTIDQGLEILKQMQQSMKDKSQKVFSGEDAFKLYDTYGFPLDLTQEILEEEGISVDEEGFSAAMQEQKNKARSARRETNYMGADATVYEQISLDITTEFTGYDKLNDKSKVCALTTEDEIVEALSDGQKGTIITSNTPFYATMGGQCADIGVIIGAEGEFKVTDTIKLKGDKVGHIGTVTQGVIKRGDAVELKVDASNRALTARNHSATHLLQKALRTVLGSHVEQSGSDVNAQRLRFDFSHFSAMTPEEITKTENLVNEKIQEAIDVVTEVMTLEEAKKTGAMALFGEKYSDNVRVVKMGDFSIELCGGTHVKNTSDISRFKIISESGVAAGVRRIEALSSNGLFDYYDSLENELINASKMLKTNRTELIDKIEHTLKENKELKSEIESMKSQAAKGAAQNVMDNVIEVGNYKFLAASVDGVDMNELRQMGDQLKEKMKSGALVLASKNDGKVNLVAMATDDAVKAGAHAGNLIKAIASKVGGGGGGRPGMAQAGGKNPEGIEEALKLATETIKTQLS